MWFTLELCFEMKRKRKNKNAQEQEIPANPFLAQEFVIENVLYVQLMLKKNDADFRWIKVFRIEIKAIIWIPLYGITLTKTNQKNLLKHRRTGSLFAQMLHLGSNKLASAELPCGKFWVCVRLRSVWRSARAPGVLSRNVSYRSSEPEEGSLAALALIKSPCQEMMMI